jgi:uncharacterized protein YeaO (DUF488 family)
MKAIAPSNELRKWFGHDPSKWEEFKKRYWKELEQNQDWVEKLRDYAKEETLTILYSAKDKEHNNAVALKECLGHTPYRPPDSS